MFADGVLGCFRSSSVLLTIIVDAHGEVSGNTGDYEVLSGFVQLPAEYRSTTSMGFRSNR
jgi:hypothetical protein